MKTAMRIGTRLVLTQIVLMTVVVAAFVIPLYTLTERMMLERSQNVQAQLVGQSINMIGGFDDALKLAARQFHKVLLGEMDGNFSLDATQKIAVAGTPAPVLHLGTQPMNGRNDEVDRFSAKSGNVATLFVRDGDDFIRIATSVLKEDGSRALGSKLDRSNPAYARLIAGEDYLGRAELFGRDYITHYSPIRDVSGKLVGASFVGLNATEGIAGLLIRLGKVKIGESGHIAIIDVNKDSKAYGTYVLHPKLNGKPSSQRVDVDGNAYLQHAIEAVEGRTIVRERDDTGVKAHMLAYATYKPWGWLIVSDELKTEMERENRVMLQWIVGGCVLLVLVLALALWWFTRVLVARPVSRLVRAMGAIRDSRDLTLRVDIHRRDEVGEVADAMNSLLESFQQALNRTSGHAVDLDHAARELAQKAATAAECSGAQQTSAQDMSTHAAELLGGMQEITRVTQEASAAARASSDAAHSGSQSLVAAVDEVNRISTTLGAATDSLRTLESSATQITNIVNVIHDIADQTNLLALNAAIEAARAGEMGRGFAVVADEVRKLAERTSVSTQEIGHMIGQMQNATQMAVQAMRESVAKAAEGAAITADARQAIDSIVEDSRQALEVVEAINRQMELQRRIVEGMAGEVENVARLAETSNNAAQTSAETAQHMAGLADALRDEVSVFRT
ncbi:methyl-accepting chemotaxis protein [Gulbenkiania mobilis]|uniref:methyl-accepting chemotaxis protein n=1 Tax=Gulbenkiania mobilis TaxID=397457 RepID=UPI0009F8903D|nr:methyl-accepting chemotaxis protein [Gulbenkiania mobilis]